MPALLGAAGTVRAQTSANLTLVSAYAARGAMLDSGPAVQLRVEHDAAEDRLAGWYGGAFASSLQGGGQGRRQGQLVAYGGRAQRLSSTLSWDLGASRTVFTGDGAANYQEWYAGLAMRRGAVRVFYSPAYYGEGRSIYLDLNGAYPLGENVHVAVHAGLLHPLERYAGASGGGADLRIALGTQIGDISVEAGWQIKAHAYLEGGAPAPALTASASLRF